MAITIQDILPHVDRCREVLDARKSGLLADRQAENLGISLNREGSVRRMWQGLHAKDIYIFKAFLDFYVDSENCGDGGVVLSRHINDPKVGDGTNGKVIAKGKYRGAFTIVRPMADDQYMLIQELRLGWIESLVSGDSVDYSEARIEQIDWYNGDGNNDHDYVTVAWKGVSPEKVHDIVKSLNDLPAENWSPVVNGNSLGSHTRLLVNQSEGSDGSSTIKALLANSRVTIESYSAWNTDRQSFITYHYNVPTSMVQALVDAEKSDRVTARVGAPDQRGLHDVVIEFSEVPDSYEFDYTSQKACTFDVISEYRFGISKDDIPDATSSAGVSQTVRIQNRGDGLFDVVIETRNTIEQELSEYISEDSSGRQVKRREIRGYTGTDPSDISSTGIIVRKNISLNQDCSKDAVVEKIESFEQTGEDRRLTVNGGVTGVVKANVRNPAAPTEPTPGKTVTYQKRPNVDGTFDVTERIDESPELDAESFRKTVKSETIGTVQRNAKIPTVPSAPVQGQTVVWEKSENDDGTYNTNLQTIVSPVLDGESKRITVTSGEQVGSIQRNSRTAPVPSSATIGTIVQYEKRDNEDGTFDISEQKITSPVLSGESNRVTVTSGTTVGAITRNSRVKTSPSSPEVGQIVQHEARQNEDGSWDVTEQVLTSPILVSEESIATTKVIRTGSGKRNDRSKKTPTTPSAGQRVTFRTSQNEDGTWDWNEIIETAVSGLVAQSGVKASCRELGRDIVEQNLTSASEPSAPTTPGIRRVWSVRERDDGTWERTIRDEVAPALQAEARVLRAKGGSVETILRNTATPPNPPAPAIGQTINYRKEENPDCSYDVSTRIETAPSLVATQIVARKDRSVVVSRKQNSTDKEPSETAAEGKIVTVVNDENPDGTWNTSKETQNGLPQSFTHTYGTRGGTASVIVFRNWTEQQVKGALDGLADGNSNSASVSPNEFGLYDGTINSSPYIDDGGGGGNEGDEPNYSYKISAGGTDFTVDVIFTKSETKAYNQAGGTAWDKIRISIQKFPEFWTVVGEKPGIRYIGKRTYKAVKIT